MQKESRERKHNKTEESPVRLQESMIQESTASRSRQRLCSSCNSSKPLQSAKIPEKNGNHRQASRKNGGESEESVATTTLTSRRPPSNRDRLEPYGRRMRRMWVSFPFLSSFFPSSDRFASYFFLISRCSPAHRWRPSSS